MLFYHNFEVGRSAEDQIKKKSKQPTNNAARTRAGVQVSLFGLRWAEREHTNQTTPSACATRSAKKQQHHLESFCPSRVFPENQYRHTFTAVGCCSPCCCCPPAPAGLPLPCAWHGLHVVSGTATAGRGTNDGERPRIVSCWDQEAENRQQCTPHPKAQTIKTCCASQALAESKCFPYNPHAMCTGASPLQHLLLILEGRSLIPHAQSPRSVPLMLKLVHLCCPEISFWEGTTGQVARSLRGNNHGKHTTSRQNAGARGAVVAVSQVSTHRDSGSC